MEVFSGIVLSLLHLRVTLSKFLLLSHSHISLPYNYADDAFPLKPYIQKPYSQIGLTAERCIFNYRLSRARRNGFGILAKRFRVFMNPLYHRKKWKTLFWHAVVFTISYIRPSLPLHHQEVMTKRIV